MNNKYSNMCKESEIYYIDFALAEEAGGIPERVKTHIEFCNHCGRILYHIS